MQLAAHLEAGLIKGKSGLTANMHTLLEDFMIACRYIERDGRALCQTSSANLSRDYILPLIVLMLKALRQTYSEKNYKKNYRL